MTIYILHLYDRTGRGGLETFTHHLYLQMVELGHFPVIVKPKSLSQISNFSPLPISYLAEEDIIEICHTSACLIAFCAWAEKRGLVKKLIMLGVPIVVHDPIEYYTEMLELASKYSHIITIRLKNQHNLTGLGFQNTFVRHPYSRADLPLQSKAGAVACTRLNYNKNNDVVIKANKLGCRIDVFGERNKEYVRDYLDKRHPDWMSVYHGVIENKIHAVAKILNRYQYAVDLSMLTMDGGGTQYSFLEAWDAGCTLIVHKMWILEGYEIVDGLNCLAVSNEYELQEAIESGKTYDKTIHDTLLESHNAINTTARMIDIIVDLRQSRA